MGAAFAAITAAQSPYDDAYKTVGEPHSSKHSNVYIQLFRKTLSTHDFFPRAKIIN